jgi:ABC-type bacteriocin/lantibiotic exporter with double-glycine peptidase domain
MTGPSTTGDTAPVAERANRFTAESLRHHASTDGLGSVFGAVPTGPPGALKAMVHRWWSWSRRTGRMPVCLQMQASDCGPAALVMTLRYHGIEAQLDGIRAMANAGRNGATARSLLMLARQHGLTGRGVRTTVDGLRRLAPGAILFWNFQHFVVLERADVGYVDVVDPAYGRRRLGRAEAAESFTGVALDFDPPVAGTRPAQGDDPTPWLRLVRLLPRGRVLGYLVATSILVLGFELVLPLLTALLVNRLLPERLTSQLALAAAGVAVIAVMFFTVQLVRSFAVVRQQAYVEKRLTLGVVDHMLSLPYHFFQVRHVGDLALRARAATMVNQVVGLGAIASAFDSLMIIVYVVAIVIADPVLACVVVLLIALDMAVLATGWRRQVTIGPEVMERQVLAQDALVAMLDSIPTLKSEGVEAKAGERWSHLLVHEVNKRLESRSSLAVSISLGSLLQVFSPLVVLVVGAWRVLAGDLSMGGLLGFMALTVVLFVPVTNVFGTAVQLAMLRPTLARLDDVLRSEPEPRHPGAAMVAEPGRVDVSDVSFVYPGATTPTLTGVNLHIEPGEFVAVVGRSGSGKSTLAMLLAGLHLPGHGRITVDGVDMAELDRPEFRRRIAYINQNAHLYTGSIRDNILYGSDTVDGVDLIHALTAAHVHEEIIALPMGYETLVGPDGSGLSGGQRQRIVLARALAKQPRLLILDEATSALDPAMEQAIFRDLLGRGLTLIVVAHRLRVLDCATQVIVLKDGTIVEAGPPGELAKANGEFACLQ